MEKSEEGKGMRKKRGVLFWILVFLCLPIAIIWECVRRA